MQVQGKKGTRSSLGSKECVEESFASGTGFGLLGLLLVFLSLETFLSEQLVSADSLRVGVQTEEDGPVDQRVLLLSPRTLLGLWTGGADDGLNLGAVNDASDIGVGNLGGGKEVVLLVHRDLVKGTEDFVEKGKGAFGPDDETTDVATWSELEEIESPDVDEFDARQVAERLYDAVVFIVNDEGATALAVTTIAHLALTGTEPAGV